MKKAILLFLVSLTGFFNSWSQQPANSLLWKISGNGLQEDSYLFGSFHILCKDDLKISDILKSKITNAKVLYSEIKLDEEGMEAKMALKMRMQNTTLESLIGKSDYAMVNERFQQITNLPLQMLDHFKPFMAISLLTMNTLSCKEKLSPETEFTKIAKENKIPNLGLETIDDQIAVIDKWSLDSQIHALTESVLHFDSSKRALKEMIAIYKLRNVDSLYQYMKEKGTSDDFELDMLINRNRNWVPIIETAIKQQPAFFVVGAGHLGGPDGVLSLLRKRGYRLTPVTY
jgi:uncharacterized protein YbaP (TraB family)